MCTCRCMYMYIYIYWLYCTFDSRWNCRCGATRLIMLVSLSVIRLHGNRPYSLMLTTSMQWSSFNISLFVHITYIKEKHCMDQNYNTMHCVITIAIRRYFLVVNVFCVYRQIKRYNTSLIIIIKCVKEVVIELWLSHYLLGLFIKENHLFIVV